jgi:hypothetical protein
VVCDSLRASQISISDGSVLVFTPGSKVFEIAPDMSGDVFLTILYGTAATTSHEPLLASFPSLSIGHINFPIDDGEWKFCVEGGVCSPSLARGVVGLFALVPGAGSRSIIAEGPARGFLSPAEGATAFDVVLPRSFFTEAYFTFIGGTPEPTSTPAGTSTPARTPSASMSSWFTLSVRQLRTCPSFFVATGWFLFF